MPYNPQHHLPDRIVKNLVKSSFVEKTDRLFMPLKKSTVTEGVKPDGLWFLEPNIYFMLEYENSRGMLHHVTKYQQIAFYHPDLVFKALFIESLNQQKKYPRNRELALFQYNRNPLSNLTIDFVDCVGSEEDISGRLNTWLN